MTAWRTGSSAWGLIALAASGAAAQTTAPITAIRAGDTDRNAATIAE